jgi:ubiquinone/menaquinone biosynthesis C-methylase UbiE
MQDAIFAEPRLARIYDLWQGDRVDLPHYLAIAAELGARRVLDVGCGTGNWACMLAERGFEVVGLDPAEASLDVARARPGGQQVRWIQGDVTSLPALAVDLAIGWRRWAVSTRRSAPAATWCSSPWTRLAGHGWIS